MAFKSFSPCEYLKPYINSYWVVDVSDKKFSISAKILPFSNNGLIFNYSPFTSFSSFRKNKNVSVKCVLGGLFTNFYSLNLTGSGGFLGILFKPGVLYKLFNINMIEIGGKRLDAEIVIGAEITNLFLQIQEAPSHDLKIKMAENYLINKIKLKKLTRSPADNVVALINEKKGNIKIKEISEYFNFSTRYLEKSFSQLIGISPKGYSNIIKFNTILFELKYSKKTNWCDLALDGGYYDQQHLINAFSKFAGLPPSKYIKQVNFLNEFYLVTPNNTFDR
jgi:AraC-like DNA-binding protein